MEHYEATVGSPSKPPMGGGNAGVWTDGVSLELGYGEIGRRSSREHLNDRMLRKTQRGVWGREAAHKNGSRKEEVVRIPIPPCVYPGRVARFQVGRWHSSLSEHIPECCPPPSAFGSGEEHDVVDDSGWGWAGRGREGELR